MASERAFVGLLRDGGARSLEREYCSRELTRLATPRIMLKVGRAFADTSGVGR
jgi:hypothetical protein